MKIMDFSPANCKNCYKCVRNCHVKAIQIVNDQAQIKEDFCIGCGKCFVVCPQNARNIKSDLDNIKTSIDNNKKMVVSIAPSYRGIYKNSKKLITALRSLGFDVIEETAIGAEIVSDLYKDYIENHSNKNYITSCCPSVNLLIQRYYPDLLPSLLPIVSPMIAHSIQLKKKYGQDCFITFVGPCISKRCEAFGYQETGAIDAILSFEELDTWLNERNINIKDLEESQLDSTASAYGQRYPLEGGISKGIINTIEANGFRSISVNGIEDCKNLFKTLTEDNLENLFIEANICTNGCIGGPAVSKNNENIHIRQLQLDQRLNVHNEKPSYEINNTSVYNRSFSNNYITKNKATDKQIKEILKSMGKITVEDELNCGACGYNTCVDKAQAVFEGMSQPEMCLPYMRSKAEKLSNIIFENTPNIIFLVDNSLNIVDINPAAEKAFLMHSKQCKGTPLSKYIDDSDFSHVLDTKENIINKRVIYKNYSLVVNQTLLYLPKQELIMAIFYDVTNVEKKNAELISLKKNTLEIADKVIEKQMRVAQEIASLLGETTAETKITLMKLQQIVLGEEGVIK